MAAKAGAGKGKRSRKFYRKKNSPAQQRYVASCRSYKNKLKRAQKYANKFGVIVTIKGVDGKAEQVRPSV